MAIRQLGENVRILTTQNYFLVIPKVWKDVKIQFKLF